LLIPDLDLHPLHLIGIGNVEVVEPSFTRDIPTRRQHDYFSVGESGEVMLDAPIAERIIDAVFLRLSV
jgi:hypothetical protein